MSNQVYRINDYRFISSDAVLFDANIWLYIYGPQGDRFTQNRATYTMAMRRIRSVRGRILLDVIVMSEFINAYSRFIYNDLPIADRPADFKNFRNSAGFKPIAERIAIKAEKILDKSELTESGFESVNLREIIRDYAAGEADFNDQILAELCRAKNLKLVTHDSDFRGVDLTILTGNPRLSG